MKTLNIQISEKEYSEFGFDKQTLSLKEFIRILSKSAFPNKKNEHQSLENRTPIVDSLLGSVSVPQNFNEEEILTSELIRKYR